MGRAAARARVLMRGPTAQFTNSISSPVQAICAGWAVSVGAPP